MTIRKASRLDGHRAPGRTGPVAPGATRPRPGTPVSTELPVCLQGAAKLDGSYSSGTGPGTPGATPQAARAKPSTPAPARAPRTSPREGDTRASTTGGNGIFERADRRNAAFAPAVAVRPGRIRTRPA